MQIKREGEGEEKVKLMKLKYAELYQLYINGKYWGLVDPNDTEYEYVIRKGDYIK